MFTDKLLDRLNSAIENREPIFLITMTEYPELKYIGKKLLLTHEGQIFSELDLPLAFLESVRKKCEILSRKKRSGMISIQLPSGMAQCFAELYPVRSHLIIAGAGHVCEPVAQLGSMLDFDVAVIDDRSEYAKTTRFPSVNRVVCEPFIDYFSRVPLTEDTYILLLTRGHRFDVLSLQELLKRDERPRYIGMIGSRRRIAGVFEQLKEDFPEESFEGIFTPVGLDIGAETPAEIAVSIMAEILKVKNQRTGHSLSDHIKGLAKLGFREGVVK